mmetsp:Transcript_2282/g.7098  ORF Transcript_2282/g.7098 Transcript_2282/m.7098 type:complete len:200 (+) Transcript_2282:355-954(+)
MLLASTRENAEQSTQGGRVAARQRRAGSRALPWIHLQEKILSVLRRRGDAVRRPVTQVERARPRRRTRVHLLGGGLRWRLGQLRLWRWDGARHGCSWRVGCGSSSDSRPRRCWRRTRRHDWRATLHGLWGLRRGFGRIRLCRRRQLLHLLLRRRRNSQRRGLGWLRVQRGGMRRGRHVARRSLRLLRRLPRRRFAWLRR